MSPAPFLSSLESWDGGPTRLELPLQDLKLCFIMWPISGKLREGQSPSETSSSADPTRVSPRLRPFPGALSDPSTKDGRAGGPGKELVPPSPAQSLGPSVRRSDAGRPRRRRDALGALDARARPRSPGPGGGASGARAGPSGALARLLALVLTDWRRNR